MSDAELISPERFYYRQAVRELVGDRMEEFDAIISHPLFSEIVSRALVLFKQLQAQGRPSEVITSEQGKRSFAEAAVTCFDELVEDYPSGPNLFPYVYRTMAHLIDCLANPPTNFSEREQMVFDCWAKARDSSYWRRGKTPPAESSLCSPPLFAVWWARGGKKNRWLSADV